MKYGKFKTGLRRVYQNPLTMHAFLPIKIIVFGDGKIIKTIYIDPATEEKDENN